MTEDNRPAPRFIRSDFVLFVFVFLSVCALILLFTFLQVLFRLPGAFVQALLLLLLLFYGWALYRTRLVSYRYSLGQRMFSVDRVVGKKVRDAHAVHIQDIQSIRPYSDALQADIVQKPFHGNKKDCTALLYRLNGKTAALLVMLSPAMKDALTTQWKALRK